MLSFPNKKYLYIFEAKMDPCTEHLPTFTIKINQMWENIPYMDPTVGGRNPAPVDMVNIPLLTGFQHVRWLAGFLPSTVWLWVGIYRSHPQN